MPTQEDRVLARIRQTRAFIRDSGLGGVPPDKVDEWAYGTLGIRPRTTQAYVRSLIALESIRYDPKTKMLISCEKREDALE